MRHHLTRTGKVLIGAIIIVLIGLGWVINYSTSQTLALAESLQFRRMLVAAQPETDTYRFFFVTNRSAMDSTGLPEAMFSSERAPGMRFGTFDTSIEPSLGIGMLINPSDWFQNEEIQLKRVEIRRQDEFLSELRRQLEGTPSRGLIININGFRERFPSALRKTAFLAHVLDLNAPILVFDWPGDQGSNPFGYRRAQGIARESGAELAELLNLITAELAPDRLSIIANSMGGEVVVEAFAALAADGEFTGLKPAVSHVVLTAPDVSHAEFGERFEDHFRRLADNMTVYVSSNDRALLMSRLLNRERRLGESTAHPEMLAQLDNNGDFLAAEADQGVEALQVYDMLEPDDPSITLVDLTPVNRTRNFHNFSLETPEYFDDLFLRLTGNERPRTRALYSVRQANGTQYWVLTRGR
ncbi:MAG: alpha/beta hydrolase [Pseudomonadota bacterium]